MRPKRCETEAVEATDFSPQRHHRYQANTVSLESFGHHDIIEKLARKAVTRDSSWSLSFAAAVAHGGQDFEPLHLLVAIVRQGDQMRPDFCWRQRQFRTQNPDLPRRIDSELNASALDGRDLDGDVRPDLNCFANFACENQHDPILEYIRGGLLALSNESLNQTLRMADQIHDHPAQMRQESGKRLKFTNLISAAW